MAKKIIIFTGEPSGDLQASLLVKQLQKLDNSIRIFAVGGNFLKCAGAQIIQDIKDLSVLGLFDTLKKLNKFKALMRLGLAKISEIKPDAVILVDFSGFNLRLAKEIKTRLKSPPKIIYYISPQVWASRPGRVETIKKFIDRMIVVFKFEEEFYKKFGVTAEFIGHPLLDTVNPTLSRQEFLTKFNLQENAPIFALLPGSRIREIKNILPIMLETAKIIAKKIPGAQFIISKPANLDNKLYTNIINFGAWHQKAFRCQAPIITIESLPYDCLNAADFVLTASGTATLETAIMSKPNVVIYKMGLFTYLLYKPLVKIPFIGMENIVAGKLIAPEFIQFKAQPKNIANTILNILNNPARLEELRMDFAALKEKLKPDQAPARAAKSILSFINS